MEQRKIDKCKHRIKYGTFHQDTIWKTAKEILESIYCYCLHFKRFCKQTKGKLHYRHKNLFGVHSSINHSNIIFVSIRIRALYFEVVST